MRRPSLCSPVFQCRRVWGRLSYGTSIACLTGALMKPHTDTAKPQNYRQASSSVDHVLTPRAFATAATCSSSLRDWASRLPVGRSATSRSPRGVRPRAFSRIHTSPSDAKCSTSLVSQSARSDDPKADAAKCNLFRRTQSDSFGSSHEIPPFSDPSPPDRQVNGSVHLKVAKSFSNCRQLCETHTGRNLGCPRTFAIGLRTRED